MVKLAISGGHFRPFVDAYATLEQISKTLDVKFSHEFLTILGALKALM